MSSKGFYTPTPNAAIWVWVVAGIAVLFWAVFEHLTEFTYEHGPRLVWVVIIGGVAILVIGASEANDAIKNLRALVDPPSPREGSTVEEKDGHRQIEAENRVARADQKERLVYALVCTSVGVCVVLYAVASWALASAMRRRGRGTTTIL